MVKKLKEPSASAVTAKEFSVVFTRPPLALEVEPGKRVAQLRELLQEKLGVSATYIKVKVSSCGLGKEEFCITFTTDPHQQIADASIKAAMDGLTKSTLEKIISKRTGLNPAVIDVEKIKPAPKEQQKK